MQTHPESRLNPGGTRAVLSILRQREPGFGQMKAAGVLLLISVLAWWPAVAQDDLALLLAHFQAERDRPVKEALLTRITSEHRDAGPSLLQVAQETTDDDTKWLAIRGIGYLKFNGAETFLKNCLSSNSSYVRANSARALGELGDASVGEDLARALSSEHDNGVIEQTALALQMLRATKATPALESKANSESPQTRLWVLGALEDLGSQREVPFIAGFLSDPNTLVAAFAASSLERLTNQDFDLPKCGPGICAGDFAASIQKAQKWWSSHKNEWQR